MGGVVGAKVGGGLGVIDGACVGDDEAVADTAGCVAAGVARAARGNVGLAVGRGLGVNDALGLAVGEAHCGPPTSTSPAPIPPSHVVATISM